MEDGAERQSDSRPMIQAIFYSEFDTTQGPKIFYQTPHNFVNNEMFDAISDYVITKPQLCGRIITLKVNSYRIMGYPMVIENKKYHRNALLWNLVFVFNHDFDKIKYYAPVLIKIALLLRNAEVESEFLFTKKEKLQEIINQLYEGFNSTGHCVISLDDVNKLYVLVQQGRGQATGSLTVKDHQVPVPVVPLVSLLNTETDLTFQRMIPFINGVNNVKIISNSSQVSNDLVKKCLQSLLYYGAIRLIDVFQYSNIYTVTAGIQQLAESSRMQRECVQYVSFSDKPAPSFEKIFYFYCDLKNDTTFRDYLKDHDLSAHNIHHRRFISFGLLNNLIRRVCRVPILSEGSRDLLNPETQHLDPRILPLLDANHSFDEICCSLSISHSELLSLLLADKRVVILMR